MVGGIVISLTARNKGTIALRSVRAGGRNLYPPSCSQFPQLKLFYCNFHVAPKSPVGPRCCVALPSACTALVMFRGPFEASFVSCGILTRWE